MDRSSRRTRSRSAIRSISTILPFAIVKAKTTRALPPGAHTSPGAPLTSAGWAARARPEKVAATAGHRAAPHADPCVIGACRGIRGRPRSSVHPVCRRRQVGPVMLEPLRQPVLFAHRSPFLDSAHHLYDESNLADVTWLTLPKNGPVPQGPDSSELAEPGAYPGRNAKIFPKWQADV